MEADQSQNAAGRAEGGIKKDGSPKIEFSLVPPSSGTSTENFHIPVPVQSGLAESTLEEQNEQLPYKLENGVLLTHDAKISFRIIHKIRYSTYTEGISTTTGTWGQLTSISGGGTRTSSYRYKVWEIKFLNISKAPKKFFLRIDFVKEDWFKGEERKELISQSHEQTFVTDPGMSSVIQVDLPSGTNTRAYIRKFESRYEDYRTTSECIDLCLDLERASLASRRKGALLSLIALLGFLLFLFFSFADNRPKDVITARFSPNNPYNNP